MNRPEWVDDLEERLERRTNALFYVLRSRGVELDNETESAVHGLAFAIEHGVPDQLHGPRLARRLGLRWRELVRRGRAA